MRNKRSGKSISLILTVVFTVNFLLSLSSPGFAMPLSSFFNVKLTDGKGHSGGTVSIEFGSALKTKDGLSYYETVMPSRILVKTSTSGYSITKVNIDSKGNYTIIKEIPIQTDGYAYLDEIGLYSIKAADKSGITYKILVKAIAATTSWSLNIHEQNDSRKLAGKLEFGNIIHTVTEPGGRQIYGLLSPCTVKFNLKSAVREAVVKLDPPEGDVIYEAVHTMGATPVGNVKFTKFNYIEGGVKKACTGDIVPSSARNAVMAPDNTVTLTEPGVYMLYMKFAETNIDVNATCHVLIRVYSTTAANSSTSAASDPAASSVDVSSKVIYPGPDIGSAKYTSFFSPTNSKVHTDISNCIEPSKYKETGIIDVYMPTVVMFYATDAVDETIKKLDEATLVDGKAADTTVVRSELRNERQYYLVGKTVKERKYAEIKEVGLYECTLADSDGNTFKLYVRVHPAKITNDKPSEVRADPSYLPVAVNGGQEVGLDVYYINSSCYIKLRDLAMLLRNTSKKFSVASNSSTNTISITTKKDYVTVGGELKGLGDYGIKMAQQCSRVKIDEVDQIIISYFINGDSYFQLQDLAKQLNFYVVWKNTKMNIDTSKAYKETRE